MLFEEDALTTVPKYFMVTNCVTISEKCAQIINHYNICLTVSIDGPAAVNDQLRVFPNGSGSHEQFLHSLELLRKHGVEPAMVEATYTSIHEKEGLTREDTANHLRERLGIKHIYLCDCSDNDEYAPKAKSVSDDAAETAEALRKIFVDRNFDGAPLNLIQTITSICRLLNTDEAADCLCDIGLCSITVTPTGDIYPCHFFVGNESFLLGNLFQQNLPPRSACPVIETIGGYTKRNRKECSVCWARNFCYKCLFLVYKAENRNAFAIEFSKYCETFKKQTAEVLLYLGNLNQSERKALYDELKSYFQESSALKKCT